MSTVWSAGDLACPVNVDPRFPEALAGALVEECRAIQQQRGACHLMLSGGGTAQALHRVLALPSHRDRLDWARMHLWLGDERPVPPGHPDSNWGMLQRNLLESLELPPASALRMCGEAEDLSAAASAYEELLRARLPRDESGEPRLDILLLGMGPDGHTASLFPGSPALDEQQRWVVANPVSQLATTRLTVTLPFLRLARRVIFLVSGKEKASALKQVLHPAEGSPELPAARASRLARSVTWWLDPALATALEQEVEGSKRSA